MDIIKIENLSFTYNGEEKKVLKDINMRVGEGDFVILCGNSGSGKTTLLRLIKRELAPKGKCEGHIFINGKAISAQTDRESAAGVGFVFQNPDNQIVTDKVWHELVFGLENLGMPQNDMKRRLAEITAFFNLESILDKNTWELSGGEKQKLNLASVMAMKPEIILLDEPLSQLDPISALDFVNILRKVNSELGTTIIMAEHNLKDVLNLADMAGIMEEGRLVMYDDVDIVLNKYSSSMKSIINLMPVSVRLYNILDTDMKCPVNVCGAKKMLDDYMAEVPSEKKTEYKSEKIRHIGTPILKMKNVCFRYSGSEKDILKYLNMDIYPGEICSILGNNGSGKTTMLKAASGILKPYSGKIKNNSKNMVYLPQNPQTLFIKDSRMEDLQEVGNREDILELAEYMNMEGLLKSHPYDLSGGEQQRAALIKVLLKSPDMIFMDEPTKGMDAESKKKMGEIFAGLKEKGITIVMVTHDIEFVAQYSDCCGILFNHEIIVYGGVREVLCGNDFYTTETARISSKYFKNILTFDELVYSIRRMEN